jgi:hypothetical protein
MIEAFSSDKTAPSSSSDKFGKRFVGSAALRDDVRPPINRRSILGSSLGIFLQKQARE